MVTKHQLILRKAKSKRYYEKHKKKLTEKTNKWKIDNYEKVKRIGLASSNKRRREKPAEHHFTVLKNRARRKGIKFNLTVKFLQKLLANTHCAVTGVPFSYELVGKSKKAPWAPSVDRIKQHKGYTRDNIQLVCVAYNTAKNEWEDETVLTMLRAFMEHRRVN